MGNLHLNKDGIHLEGVSEFLLPVYVKEIQSRRVSYSFCSSHQSELGITTWDWDSDEKLSGRKAARQASMFQGWMYDHLTTKANFPLISDLMTLWCHLVFVSGSERLHSFSVQCSSPPHFLSSSNSALSGPPIGRRWVIGCLSAPLRPYTNLQEITDDYRGTRVPPAGFPIKTSWYISRFHFLFTPPLLFDV